jgi:acetyl esterase/lipase
VGDGRVGSFAKLLSGVRFMHRRTLAKGLAVIMLLGLAGPAMAQAQAPQEKAKAKATAKPQPPPIPEGVKVERDLEYAKVGDTALLLDLYRPESSGAPLPLVVWVHGGAWRGGSKDVCPAVPLSGRGYVVASINYRLTGVATFPAQIEDCRAAIRWLRAHASKYNLDPRRVGVWGGSAGGHLVALLGTSGDVSKWDTVGGNTDQSARVQAVCDFFGPADFLAESIPEGRRDADSAVGRLLGGAVNDRKEEARQASPLTYISADDPPFLIFHGDQDKTVPIAQSEILEDALKKAGIDATFIRVKNGGHGFGAGSDPNPAEIRARVIAFFDKHLKGEAKAGDGASGK